MFWAEKPLNKPISTNAVQIKGLYKKMYIELSEIGEVNDACFVECLIKDVEEEKCEINQYYINQKMMDFDMSYILCWPR